MNIVALSPYNKKMGKAFEVCCDSNIGNITLIGKQDKIESAMKNYNFIYELIDIENEEEIIEYVKKIMNKEILIIFGNISEYYQKKLFDVNQESNFGLINVLDIEGFNNYIFTSTYLKKKHFYFENKKNCIIAAYKFMNKLGIKKSNVTIISSEVSKEDFLEANIIRAVEKKYKNLKIMDPAKITDVLLKKDKFMNMLIFKNYDVTKMFIDAISFFSNTVVGSINYCDIMAPLNNAKYFINFNEEMNEKNFLFSILMVAKSIEKDKNNVTIIA